MPSSPAVRMIFARRIRADAMALDARQTALLRPAAVAVHDDGDVPRQERGGFGAQMWWRNSLPGLRRLGQFQR